MDVFIAHVWRKLPGSNSSPELVERREHVAKLALTQEPRACKDARVRLRAAHIVRRETPVEIGGLGQGSHDVGWTGGKAPAPQGDALDGLFRRICAPVCLVCIAHVSHSSLAPTLASREGALPNFSSRAVACFEPRP